MRLKTFTAPSMAEAMAQVKKALGPDAIIVSTTQLKRGQGVQITAAIEEALIEAAIEEALAEVKGERAQPAPPPEAAADAVARALAFHGVPAALAKRLHKTAQGLQTRDPAMALAGALDMAFKFVPLPAVPERPILLYGPPGAGKTVTAAKIAAQAVLAGRALNAISCDTARAGGIEQFAAFVRILRHEPRAAPDVDALTRLVAEAKPGTVTLIDTQGANPYDPAEIEELRRRAAAVRAEPMLVLSAGGDPAEAADHAAAYARLKPRNLIFTRLDLARRLGAVLAAMEAAGAPLGAVADTPFVANGLQPVNPIAISRLLLRVAGDAPAAAARKAAS
ncbi:MAG: AAA family ATPase [Alphaproteobacteria bacterium]|nr:AAA family ATPase [Alphaproteobacteria bacterium]